MKANKMFLKIGYEKVEEDEIKIIYEFKEIEKRIMFNKNWKTAYIMQEEDGAITHGAEIGIDEAKAIELQLKELYKKEK